MGCFLSKVFCTEKCVYPCSGVFWPLDRLIILRD